MNEENRLPKFKLYLDAHISRESLSIWGKEHLLLKKANILL